MMNVQKADSSTFCKITVIDIFMCMCVICQCDYYGWRFRSSNMTVNLRAHRRYVVVDVGGGERRRCLGNNAQLMSM